MFDLLVSFPAPIQWTLAFGLVFLINLTVALLQRQLGKARWGLACLVVTAPALAPYPFSGPPPIGGILVTVLTTITVVTCARLADLDSFVRVRGRGMWQLFLWMSLPMIRSLPAERSARSANRRRAGRFAFFGVLKRLAWEPLGLVVASQNGESVPWIVRSAFLMLYFLLTLTAVCDLLTAMCLLLGFDVDELFDAPLWARSPRDFWSRRWNKFINRFALKHVALPVGRSWSPRLVIFVVFVTSGAFHEYFAWGVGGGDARYGAMSLFFVTQGLAVWLGEKIPAPPHPHALGTALTFVWMAVSSPLFFAAVEPAVLGFGYPSTWLPF